MPALVHGGHEQRRGSRRTGTTTDAPFDVQFNLHGADAATAPTPPTCTVKSMRLESGVGEPKVDYTGELTLGTATVAFSALDQCGMVLPCADGVAHGELAASPRKFARRRRPRRGKKRQDMKLRPQRRNIDYSEAALAASSTPARGDRKAKKKKQKRSPSKSKRRRSTKRRSPKRRGGRGRATPRRRTASKRSGRPRNRTISAHVSPTNSTVSQLSTRSSSAMTPSSHQSFGTPW